MPIYNLTGDARLMNIGQLRKGGPKPNDRQPGPDLDQALRFVGVDDDIQAAWEGYFGPAPIDTELSIRLPYATVDEVWQAWREAYTASALQYRCDGREHVLYLADDGVTYIADKPVPCPGSSCEAKACGRLEVIIPDLGRMGVITVLTTSIHDIRNIDGCLRMLAITLGDLRRVPLRLTRVQRMISTPSGTGRDRKRVRRAKWLLHIEPEPEWVALMMPRHEPAVIGAGAMGALPAPVDGDDLDGEALASDLALLLTDLAGDGFTERIDACGSKAELQALVPEINAIEEAKHKANVWRLYWRRFVALADRAASSATPAQLATIAAELASVPADTAGLGEARSHLGARRGELIEAGAIERPATVEAARQPALVG